MELSESGPVHNQAAFNSVRARETASNLLMGLALLEQRKAMDLQPVCEDFTHHP
jgi:hypothetical protein